MEIKTVYHEITQKQVAKRIRLGQIPEIKRIEMT